ncbi:SDR family oxidoreductase [Rhizobium leguminosarum]|uniref:SDR family oxidoreductase n=1 Tax=Rhizobium leguminosarum TaxID=384 RepID=UPI001FED6F1B|nr:SDR family oxidoreductase [Rhizobium leguminosarum]
MIASPLQRFSQAARDLDPDKGPERPFEERGPPEIRTLAKSLNDMRSRVRGMIEARTRMLRAISHDLRTPLTRLRLRTERSTELSLRDALLADIDALTLMIEETLVERSRKGRGMMKRIPVGRFAEPADSAEVVLFLISDQTAMVNGISMPVDGGYMIA